MVEPLYACEVSCRERTRESGCAAQAKWPQALRWLNPKGFQVEARKKWVPRLCHGNGGKWAAAELGEPSICAMNRWWFSRHVCQRNANEILCHILVTSFVLGEESNMYLAMLKI